MKKNLDNIIYLCEQLENPQKKIPTIHIAGTNGKGTTSHILSSLLQQGGLKVGLYTSPHYKDFRERIKINGDYIKEQDVISFTEYVQESIKEITPSFFEITVAMAFDYFHKQEVDIAVIETGLGGRLDSTNIIKPKLSVITNIGYDHMNMLGDTLAEIAGEKAGIIKENTPVIIGERQQVIQHVFEKVAKEKKSTLSYAEDICHIDLVDSTFNLSRYEISLNQDINFEIRTPLNGPFQIHNIRTATAAYVNFLDSESEINTNLIADGLKDLVLNTNYQGRWHIQSNEPLVILDSAHNIDGINYITRELEQLNKPLHLVLGFVKDKDWKKLLNKFPENSKYYFCTPSIQRGLPTTEFQSYVLEQNLNALFFDSVAEAKASAIQSAEKDDCVFIGGSTFVVAEAL